MAVLTRQLQLGLLTCVSRRSNELVGGRDLRVVDGHVAMRTTQGINRSTFHRRVDDAYLDPLTPTLIPPRCRGSWTPIVRYCYANARHPYMDDKAIYSYMPEIIEFYTGRKAILAISRHGASGRTACSTCWNIFQNWW